MLLVDLPSLVLIYEFWSVKIFKPKINLVGRIKVKILCFKAERNIFNAACHIEPNFPIKFGNVFIDTI